MSGTENVDSTALEVQAIPRSDNPPMAVVRSEEAATLARLNTVRATLAPDLTDNELHLFAMVAVRSGLDPFARQIFAVKRNSGRGGQKMTIQTGIDGYRSIASRTGEYDGQDEPSFGPMPCPACGGPHPESATVRVYRKGVSRPIAATAFWHEYVPGEAFMWNKMPRVMIAKVAEALALRKAFPWDPTRQIGIGADVYTTEEMAQAESPADPPPSLQARLQARVQEDGGISVADFAAAVADVEPATIREIRDLMFPGVGSVSALAGIQRKALLDRILAGPVQEEVQEADVAPGAAETPVEVVEGVYQEVQEEAPVVEGEPYPAGEVQTVACEAGSPFTEGAICLLPKRHRGAHRASESEAWPR